MIPIKDQNRVDKTPIINYLLIAANILVFSYMLTLSRQASASFLKEFSFIPSNFNIPALFTSQFIHGGLLHLFSNMIFLYVFGDNIEDYLGHIKYLFFYLLIGMFAALSHYLINQNSPVPTIGASGSIAGVMGAYLLLFPNSRIDVVIPLLVFFPIVSLPAFTMIVYWIILQFLQGFGSAVQQAGAGIAYFAHIGGFFSGLFLVRLFRRN